jgi:hypothetical protein
VTPPSDIETESIDFATEAERHRLQGDAHAAVHIAETGLVNDPKSERGRMALALALIDLGDLPRARTELADCLAPTGLEPIAEFDDTLGDEELDSAFETAETNPDEMMSANRVVEQTLEDEAIDVPEAGFDVTHHPTYATETMASLLAEQGRRAEAERVREALSAPAALPGDESLPFASMPSSGDDWAGTSVGPDLANRLRVVATLEGWLHNLRRIAEYDARVNAGERTAGGAA